MSRLEIIRPRKLSLWDRVRSYTLGPLNLKDPEVRKYFQSGDTVTGVSVSEYTAMNYSAVWSAVNLIAGDVASLPLVLYRKVGKNKERYDGHPLYRLIHDAPNPEMSSMTFRQTLQAHILTWGNGYAEIERDVAGRPKSLWPLTPDRVHSQRDKGKLEYRVTNANGRDVVIDAADMLHIPGLGWDGVQGYSPIAKARDSVALGLAAERFGGSFYGNGSTFGGVITHPTKFATPAARQNFEQALKTRHKGVERAHGLLLLEEGMEYAQIGIPPDQAQFLESRQFQITEIARWFNVPPHKIGDLSRATFSNIEQQNIEYFQTTLIHWLEAWEQELMRKLVSPLERNQQFIEHVVEGLLRGDSQGRAALESTEFQIGGLTPNEARALANRNPVDGGDRAFVPMNMVPLDRIDDVLDAQIAKWTATAQPKDGGASARQIAELREALAVATAQRDEKDAEVKQAQLALATVVDDMTVANVGTVEARTATAAAEAARIAAEGRVETLAEQLGIAESLRKDAEDRLAIAAASVAERDASIAGLSELVQEREQARDHFRKGLTETHENLVVAEDALAREQQQREADRDAHAGITADRDARINALEAVVAERATEMTAVTMQLDTAMATLSATTSERDVLTVSLQRACDEHAEAALLSEARRASDLLALNEAMAHAAEAVTQAREAQAASVAAELAREQADLDRQIAEAAQVAANQARAAIQDAYAAKLTAALTAQRAVVVDVFGRIVRRETEKARRNQATSQKLRAWSASFYGLHQQFCEDALLPAIRAHLALVGSDADPQALTRELAQAHIAHSQDQILAVVDGEPDELHTTLDRVLTRWEVERPGAVADRLLAEGVAYVRSIR